MIPPRQVRMDTLTTTKKELALDALLADDSTFYGDLFPHAVQGHGELYLEDALPRAPPAPHLPPTGPRGGSGMALHLRNSDLPGNDESRTFLGRDHGGVPVSF